MMEELQTPVKKVSMGRNGQVLAVLTQDGLLAWLEMKKGSIEQSWKRERQHDFQWTTGASGLPHFPWMGQLI